MTTPSESSKLSEEEKTIFQSKVKYPVLLLHVTLLLQAYRNIAVITVLVLRMWMFVVNCWVQSPSTAEGDENTDDEEVNC